MITLRNVTLRRSARVLLDSTSVTINPGEKVGLVGRNGAGKSTLFALLNGSLHEDGGEFFMPAQWRMAQVEQNMPETSESATRFVLEGDSRLTELGEALARAETAGDGMVIAQAHSDLADAGVHDATARAQSLILGLGFQVAELEKPVNSFSGGWRMRLQLARALMCPSDILLLDEPTNHLDLDALVWLEAWLKRYPGTLVVISHDREFLDAVTDATLHIEHAKLTRYGGNYSKFEELRAQQLVLQQSAYERQQDKINHLQKFIDRFKAKASKAKQAQSRVKALERMEKIAPVLASADFTFEFKEPANLPNPMLAITDASFGYRNEDSGEETTILRHVNRSVLAGQRIGILGANGQGKSTLVKTIAREMAQLAGKVTEGKGLNIGYFAQQELDVLRPDDSPLAHMVRLAKDLGPDSKEPSREQDLRNYLGSFNFTGDMVGQAVGTMSGGEKARLVLAMIVWQRPNLLLLDEPTNHLDLATREALSMALNSFDGTVMLVSHDRALLRAVCDDFWLVGRGKVDPFDGDLDDYQRYLMEESRRLREEARLSQAQEASEQAATDGSRSGTQEASSTAGNVDPREQRRLAAQARQLVAEKTKPFRKELEQIDKRLPQLTAERGALEEKLSTQGLSGTDIAEAGKQLKQVNDSIDQLEERWLELSEQIESIQQEMGAVA
ncbi:ATP-binding cassette domain-containing protein [Diaphorobacter ruginosibacter]|uniref:Probable ATP-binding protein YheS n=1 Tax=Diaphorobacter ruginosibacter TaxID=1715720 RepID=A0A7G9RUN1_9BURK|nr:ATP-binding cassette domain-containing protein [Diaphorobacter ruginosibacter]QNN59306.1 ATP-binding cassette domain-containing protein [Diaphorobacter ruginosibacter]